MALTSIQKVRNVIVASLLLVIVLASTIPYMHTTQAQQNRNVLANNTEPFSALMAALEEEVRILFPTWATPTSAQPGGFFQTIITGPASLSISTAFAINVETGEIAELSVMSVEKVGDGNDVIVRGARSGSVSATLAVPESVGEGLYNIFITLDDGSTLWMPRSLYIYTSPPDEIVLLHMSDVHLGAIDEGVLNDYKNTRYIALVNTLKETIGLDLVVATGDLIDIGNQIVNYKNLAYHFNQMLVPTLMVPGNHNWAQVTSLEDFLFKFYGKYVVPARYWSYEIGNFLFIGLDSQSEGFVEEEGLDFLEQTLEKYEGTGVKAVIMFHHPLFSKPGSYKGDVESFKDALYGSWEAQFDLAKRFFDIIDRYESVVAVLSGHVHRDADVVYYRPDNSTVYFITTTTANHGTPQYWGAKIVRITSQGDVEVISLDREYRPDKGSLDTSAFRVYSSPGTGGLSYGWTFDLTDFQLGTKNLRLVFPLSKSVSPDVYLNNVLTVGLSIENIKIVDQGLYYLAIADVEIQEPKGKIVIYAEPDTMTPTIEVESLVPSKPTRGSVVTIQVRVSDAGWGVESVRAYLVSGSSEEELPVFSGLYLDVYIVRFLAVPGMDGVKIVATDMAGNEASQFVELSVPAPPTTTTATETQTTETTTPTETEATTTEETESPVKTPPETTATETNTEGEMDTETEIAGEEEKKGTGLPEAGREETGAGDEGGAFGTGSLTVIAAALIAAAIILGAALYRRMRS